MDEHEWVREVLRDLAGYARRSRLDALAAELARLEGRCPDLLRPSAAEAGRRAGDGPRS